MDPECDGDGERVAECQRDRDAFDDGHGIGLVLAVTDADGIRCADALDIPHAQWNAISDAHAVRHTI